MVDSVSVAVRSRMMAGIKSANTMPERKVRSLLHGMGLRFRLHRTDLPGKPDIVLPRHETVVFVHGCFWHRHKGCKFAYRPKSREEFWHDKFAANIARDIKVQKQLQGLGWRVLTVWECELRNLDKLERRLNRAFRRLHSHV